MFSVNLCTCVKEKDRACTCVSMLTTSQHCDTWSHIQIQGRFEGVASCRADAADQRQEPQRQGSSSLHLRRAPHGTVRSLRPGRTHHQHIHLTTRKHTHAVTHPHDLTKHWQACRQAGRQGASNDAVEWTCEQIKDTYRRKSVTSRINTSRKTCSSQRCLPAELIILFYTWFWREQLKE